MLLLRFFLEAGNGTKDWNQQGVGMLRGNTPLVFFVFLVFFV